MHSRSFWRGLMDSERSRMSTLTGWQLFRISSTYFQPSLTASTPSSDPLAISVKKGENFWGTAFEGECHFKGELFMLWFYFMFIIIYGFLKHLWYFGLLIFKVVIQYFFCLCPCCFCKLLGFVSVNLYAFMVCTMLCSLYVLLPILLAKCYAFSLSIFTLVP